MAIQGRWWPCWPCTVPVAIFALLYIDGAAAGADKVSARDHYEVLGLTREASQAEIKRAHKKMALQYHPDKNREKDAEKMFIEIQKAYEVLGDPDRRRKYDARSRFFSEEAPDDAPSGEEGTENAPDGGRGTPFDTVEEITEAVSGTKLYVIHVYTDQGNIFGGWMERLPPEFQLGHVNLERNPMFNRALHDMHGGPFGSVPLLMVCKQRKCQSFRPSMGGWFFDPFQSVVSNVVETALSLVDYWEHITRIKSDGGLQSFCDFSPGQSAKLRVIFIVEDQDERYWSIFSAASRMHGIAHFAQMRYFDAADRHGYPHSFMGRFGVTSLPAAVFVDPLTGAHATVSGRRASDSVLSITEKLFLGERVTSKLFVIPELDAASHLARCEHGGGCEWLVLLATSSSFEATSEEFGIAWGAFTMACQSLSALRTHLPGTPVCFWLRLGRSSEWSALLEAAGVRPGAAVTAAVLDGRKLAVAPEGATSNHRLLFRWARDAISGRVESRALPKSQWPPLPASLERRVHWQESMYARLESLLESFQTHVTAASAPVIQFLVGWAMADPLTALGLVLLVGSLVALAWSWVFEDETQPSIRDVLQDMQFQVTCSLHRKDEQAQLGFGVVGHKDGGLEISNVAPDGSLDAWFADFGGRPERQVLEGDRIVCVSFPDKVRGKIAHARCPQAMAKALREVRDVTLTIIPSASRLQGLQLQLGHLHLDGMTLKSSATLAYGSRLDGFRHDLEVVHISPELAAWNAERRCEGACYSQTLELGDRVVAVGQQTCVVEHLEKASPDLLVAKWRPAGTMTLLQLEVTLERANPEESWGMQLRRVCSFDAKGTRIAILVRKIFPGKLADHNAQLAQLAQLGSSNGCQKQPVLAGDRLVSANGCTDVQQISEELKAAKVALQFERWQETKPCDAEPPVEAAHTPGTSQANMADSGAAAGKDSEGSPPTSAVHRKELNTIESVEKDGWGIELENLACDVIKSDVQTPTCHTQDAASASTPEECIDATRCPDNDECAHQRAALAARRQQAQQKAAEQAAPAPAVQVQTPPFEGLDGDGTWMQSCTLCVIAARGSPLYLNGVLALQAALQPLEQVKFYSDQRLPLASLLVALPKESRCRWFNLPLEHCQHHNEALSATFTRIERLVQQVLEGETGLLPICFDPADFASHNFGACFVSPVDVTNDQKLD